MMNDMKNDSCPQKTNGMAEAYPRNRKKATQVDKTTRRMKTNRMYPVRDNDNKKMKKNDT